MAISFWKIRQLVTISDFDSQGAKSKPETRRLIWVVSRVIQTHGLAARAILVQENWLFSWFCGGFWKIRQLVTPSDLGWEGLIWSVLVSAPLRGPGKVSSLKNKLSRAVFVAAILQSEGFWHPGTIFQNLATMIPLKRFLVCQETHSRGRGWREDPRGQV